jgi:hypothetical protein
VKERKTGVKEEGCKVFQLGRGSLKGVLEEYCGEVGGGKGYG